MVGEGIAGPGTLPVGLASKSFAPDPPGGSEGARMMRGYVDVAPELGSAFEVVGPLEGEVLDLASDFASDAPVADAGFSASVAFFRASDG